MVVKLLTGLLLLKVVSSRVVIAENVANNVNVPLRLVPWLHGSGLAVRSLDGRALSIGFWGVQVAGERNPVVLQIERHILDLGHELL